MAGRAPRTGRVGSKSLDAKSAGLNTVSSTLGAGLDSCKRELLELDLELKEDKQGKKEMDNQLQRLKTQRETVLARLKANKQFTADYERDVGPFERRYDAMVAQVGELYGEAKRGHAEGIKMLVREFQYHPAYKRWSDTFTATPFVPK